MLLSQGKNARTHFSSSELLEIKLHPEPFGSARRVGEWACPSRRSTHKGAIVAMAVGGNGHHSTLAGEKTIRKSHRPEKSQPER
jgi:hypothetical protein